MVRRQEQAVVAELREKDRPITVVAATFMRNMFNASFFCSHLLNVAQAWQLRFVAFSSRTLLGSLDGCWVMRWPWSLID